MTAEFWQYDARLGRRWNIDPVTNASLSPYACFNNNPILYSDVNGDDPDKNKAAKSIKTYEKKFMKILKNNGGDIVAAHQTMATKYNGKKWMWVNADESENTSGFGQDHGKYYHASDLFKEAKPEFANARTNATPPAPINVTSTDFYRYQNASGNSVSSMVYPIPTSGTVNITVTPAANTTLTVNFAQGDNTDPTLTTSKTNIAPAINVTANNSPAVASFSVDATKGNFMYIEYTNINYPGNSTQIAATPNVTLTPNPPTPAGNKMRYFPVISTPSNRNVKDLNNATLKELNRQFTLPR